MTIKAISWQETLPIRHMVLWPDKPESFCQVDGDEQALHYGLYCNDQLVCVASVFIENNRARLRKFATLESHQRQGLGSQMIAHILSELQAQNIGYFWCDARISAVAFYQRFGLEKLSERFYKADIGYYQMGMAIKG